MLSAIVLAGAPATGFDESLKSRAMVKVGGVTMLDRVLSALTSKCDQILVVGDVETDLQAQILTPAKTLMENIDIALKKVTGDYVLLATSDIPLINKECVSDFIEKGISLDCGFVYPICKKEKCLEKYPNLKRTYVTIKEGSFTGGNLMLMKKDFLLSIMPIMQDLYLARKKPVKLAKMIGFGVIWKLLLCKIFPNALDIDYLENKVSNIFCQRVKAYIVDDPAICEDLDSPEELKAFEDILGEKKWVSYKNI